MKLRLVFTHPRLWTPDGDAYGYREREWAINENVTLRERTYLWKPLPPPESNVLDTEQQFRGAGLFTTR